MRPSYYFPLLCFLAAIFLGACSTSTPKLIASAPSSNATSTIPYQSPNKGDVIYISYIEMEAYDINLTADRAAHLALNWGGYASPPSSWYVNGHLRTSVELSIPPAGFEGFRQELLKLGRLISERTSGSLSTYGDSHPYAKVTLVLHPASPYGSRYKPPGYYPPLSQSSPDFSRPLRTIRAALGISTAIFAFLLDALIWMIVVVGPFFLIGWATWVLSRKIKRLSPPNPPPK
jgi:hypothetical protein